MGHAPGQASHDFHFLRLPQLRLAPPVQGFLGLLLFRDVPDVFDYSPRSSRWLSPAMGKVYTSTQPTTSPVLADSIVGVVKGLPGFQGFPRPGRTSHG